MNSSAYLKFVNYQGPLKADYQTLNALHELHTQYFAFENLTPYFHQEVKLDEESLVNKFLVDKRGGYCFEQNLLFSRILTDIGFKVKGLGGRVLWSQPEDLITRRSHMLLLVSVGTEEYLADVGFGGLTLTNPLKFLPDVEQLTSHEKFRIGRMGDEYKLEAHVGENWKTLYRFDLQEQFLIDYDVANYYLYTHPTSLFRNVLIAARPVSEGRYALNNNLLTFYPRNGMPSRRTLKDIQELKDVLKNVFGIRVPDTEDLNKRLNSIFEN